MSIDIPDHFHIPVSGRTISYPAEPGTEYNVDNCITTPFSHKNPIIRKHSDASLYFPPAPCETPFRNAFFHGRYGRCRVNPGAHIAYLKRYWRRNRFVFGSGFTVRRFLNFMLAERESKWMSVKVHSRPWDMFIDPINSCPLKCPLCATGMRLHGRKQMMLSLDKYRRYLDQVAPWLYRVRLFNYGEPLLNPAVFDMIAYAKSKKLIVQINSNLNIWRDEFADRLVTSGLDTLIIAFDGLSQETYSAYRIEGDVAKVKHAVEAVAAAKKRLASNSPELILQFLMQKKNEHEYDGVKAYAERIGAVFSPQPLTFDITDAAQRTEWLPDDNAKSHYNRELYSRKKLRPETRCGFLWNLPVINVDGGISPCCHVFFGSTDFGSLEQDSFKTIWNNAAFREARRIQRKRRTSDAAIVCNRCINEAAFTDAQFDLTNEYRSNLLR